MKESPKRKPGKAKRAKAPSAKVLDAEIARLRRAARKPGLIPGIHNYCDRWCERCPLTARCAIADLKPQAGAAHPAADDSDKEKFWDELVVSFAAVIRMIRRDAKRRGIDLSSPELQAEP